MTELGSITAIAIAWYLATGATASMLAWTGHPWISLAALAIGGCMTIRYRNSDDKKNASNGDANARP